MPQPSLGWESDTLFSLPEDYLGGKVPSFDLWSSLVKYSNILESGKGSQEADNKSSDIRLDSLYPSSNIVTKLLGYMAVRIVARYRFFRAISYILGK